VKQVLTDFSDMVWKRIRGSVDGLADDEYFWEPAPGCWSIRQRADGSWRTDWPLPRPEPEPFTTIAWRLWHLIDMYGENRAPSWLGVPAQGDAIGIDAPDPSPPSSAETAIAMLERAHDRWEAHLALTDDALLAEPIGQGGPDFVTRPKAAYVLHMFDEQVHHGAEVALLRDLWRWQRAPAADDPTVERVIRNDATVLDDATPSAELVDTAASYARWELVTGFVERGAPVSTTGRTALHLAAGAGEVDVVKVLLGHGADPNAKDPEYHATPRQWADFLHHPKTAEFLKEHGA
jgi:uncharacterized damage-inducible protein DinB